MIKKVYVYRTERQIWAYFISIRDRPACIHEVEPLGITPAKIKAAAIREHREKCGDRVTP
jgi:hypothetical protein